MELTEQKQTKRKKPLVLFATLLILSFVLLGVWETERLHQRRTATREWVEIAQHRSLRLALNDESMLPPILSRLPILDRFRRPVIVLLSHEPADFEVLSQLPQCPTRITIGFNRQPTAKDIIDTQKQLEDALAKQR